MPFLMKADRRRVSSRTGSRAENARRISTAHVAADADHAAGPDARLRADDDPVRKEIQSQSAVGSGSRKTNEIRGWVVVSCRPPTAGRRLARVGNGASRVTPYQVEW